MYYGKQTYVEASALKRSIIEAKMKVYEPLSTCLNDAVEMIEQEEVALQYVENAPSTQHEEDQHGLMSSTISDLPEYYDPE